MPLARFQGVADEEVVIPDEDIGAFVAEFPQPMLVGIEAAWQKPAPLGSVAVTYPRWDEMANGVGSAKAESVEFPERDIGMSDTSITPALYGFAIKRSDEAEAGSPSGIRAGMLAEALKYHYTAISAAALASLAGLSAQAGNVTDTYNLDRLKADISAYHLLNLDGLGMPAAIISNGMAQDLTDSLTQTGATMPVSAGDTFGTEVVGGYMGTMHGIPFYRSSQLATSGAGRVGGMFPVGDRRSPIGLAVTEMPNVRMTRGDTMELRAATQHVCRAWYGAGVTNDRNGQELLGRV